MTKIRKPGMAAIGLFAAMSLALSACGGSEASTDAGSNGNDKGKAEASADAGGDTTAAQFGEGCAAVPANGAGSFDGMADDPVATAASNNPLLSTLVTAVGEAGLGDTLNSADGITVFAPTDDAFKAMDKATLDKAMKDPKGLLTTVLTHHVVKGQLAPEDLAGTHKTLAGDEVSVEGSGEDFTVDGSAEVICGNVQTANATVYIIDGVLLPQS